MLTQPTIDILRKLRLQGLAEAYLRQLQDPRMNELTFEERFGLLIDHQWTERQNRQVNKLLREARLKVQASPEDIDYSAPRELDRLLIRQLLAGQWLTSHHNLLVTGPTGVGKTFLVCALATAACRQGFKVRYYRMSRLFQDILLAKGDGTYGKLANQLTRVDLLILDDWGLAPLAVAESRELLDILDDRVSLHSTCLASQLPVDLWHQHFADPTLADAILDRLIHRAYRLKIQGDSMRKALAPLPAAGKSDM
ncbi:IS21-like element helper ATPase IstB [Paenibacillus cremeus]|uniref:AAA family ATPase n=1 Tax=Paenibacillus cremeus TaxID=2163881 RepID=A0A559JBQ1_9BACL|nr:IS21-like element helper ATPase IstB [Paenibacillus cremeus]TVX97300.1 AAA family ATPase [Paenibacillus cremeus]